MEGIVSSPPTDGISDLSFSPAADLLAASSFDNQTRIWEVQGNGSTVPKAAIQHDAPSLCCTWSKDGTKLFSGGADKAGKMMDITTGQSSQVAGHDAPISCARFVENVGSPGTMIVTGSWDKTVKYWDLRTPNPAFTLQMPERVYSMDVQQPLMVVATAERHLMIYNLNAPSQVFKQLTSPLKWQTRVVACFPNATGFAIGSIEGRVGIKMAEDKDSALDFSFKCHRDDKNNVHAVNAISFHPTYGTFSTAGGDGTFSFWDKDSKQRLKPFPAVGSSISATAFNRNGTIFAYAASYDWGKGHEHYAQGTPNKIFLHATKDEDVKPKPAKPKR
ncbi:WD40 repeat-like protein [Rhizoclosmatium globosum]|uniref:WD40 repeat-like protein n=1 Tax=Rhizoclosmatium globosum TaxID=329046 RepID=A0A1Y2CLJ6_9FUNG|nr:WD40 repeat-like protein [Rhizoclosmatium globosum]|eukprot:ORY47836.1 WD40 repeat-like protein [Rhizoclosmatium globosum]